MPVKVLFMGVREADAHVRSWAESGGVAYYEESVDGLMRAMLHSSSDSEEPVVKILVERSGENDE